MLIESDGGFGCLQPWLTLGDEPLEVHLEALRLGRSTSLTEATLRCCEIDADARKAGHSLLADAVVPPSHMLARRGLEDLPAAKANGLVKLKDIKHLEAFAEVARVRLDFNASLDAEAFLRFAENLSDDVRGQIDFVEDPCGYEAELWERLSRESGLDLALDRGPADATKGFAVRVWKPALQAEAPAGIRYCITHNMDHAIGQRYAALRAVQFDGELVACGLTIDPADDGPGLGCDSQLAELEWRQL